MELIEPGVDAPVPNVCMLCESRPTDAVLIDTGRSSFTDTVPIHPLQGRKMVCAHCAENLGAAIGMLQAREAAALRERADGLAAQHALDGEKIYMLEEGHLEAFRKLVEDRTWNRPGPKTKTQYERDHAAAEAGLRP